MDVLRQVFGGSDPHQQVQQYQRGQFTDLDQQQVASHYQGMVQYAPPQVLEQAHEHAFGQLPLPQRRQLVDQFQQVSNDPQQPFTYGFSGGQQDYEPRNLGRMMAQAQQQQPDLVQRMLGAGGALSNPLAKAALAGAVALAAKNLLGHR